MSENNPTFHWAVVEMSDVEKLEARERHKDTFQCSWGCSRSHMPDVTDMCPCDLDHKELKIVRVQGAPR